MNLTKHFFFFCLLCCSFQMHAQVSPQKRDSLKMYRNIENYSQKRGFTRFIHRLIFEPVVKKPKVKKNKFQKIKTPTFKKASGKIIRNINIYSLDPFGYSELDSTKTPKNWSQRAGNAIHNKTSRLAIRNLLLIKRNKPLDTLLLLESQRLIRSQRYIRSVRVTAEVPSVSSDSVDIYIRVLDSWSLIPDFSISSSRMTIDVNERNFMGTGHQFRNTYKKSLNSNDNGYRSLYMVPNILNTYIATTLSYDLDLQDNFSKVLKVERPFFSPYTRWAAGVYFDQQYLHYRQIDSTDVEIIETSKFNTQDYWAGHAYQIFKGSSEKSRTTNLVTAARYFKTKYLETPASDTVQYFSSEKMYMLSLGISSRQFTQDKFLFNYNVVEDIPTGIVYSITAGYQQKNERNRYYYGARAAYGKYFKFGYLSTEIEYGSYYDHGIPEQNAFTFQLVYFTNLIETTRWKWRQFIKPQFIIGNQRMETESDRLNLNEERGIQGFNSTVNGTKKVLVTLQTQGYSPWQVVGFRFNPFIGATFGMLGDAQNGFQGSKLYSQFGAGFIVSNDFLVFSAFQLSFSFYPTIPGNGGNLFKTNSFKTSDFTLQEFDVSKPRLVRYQ